MVSVKVLSDEDVRGFQGRYLRGINISQMSITLNKTAR